MPPDAIGVKFNGGKPSVSEAAPPTIPICEDVGIDGEDVRHRGEGRETGLHLPADGRAVLIEFKEAVEHLAGSGLAGLSTSARSETRLILPYASD